MDAPEGFEVLQDYACYRLQGHGSLAEAAVKVMDAIAYAKQQGLPRLLIDVTKWTGHGSPDSFERYKWATAFAEVAGPGMRLSMVVRPELMDPEKFEVLVAKNRGMMGNVFDSEEAALGWLLNGK